MLLKDKQYKQEIMRETEGMEEMEVTMMMMMINQMMTSEEMQEAMAAEVGHLTDHKAFQHQLFHLNLDKVITMMRRCDSL